MKIGIVSDTHNNIELAQKAIKIFSQNRVDLVVHAGDITSSKMLRLFKDFRCKFVLGNGDIDDDALNAEAAKLGFGKIEASSTFEAGGKKIIVFHGNDVPLFRAAMASGEYDYVIKGHTHMFENYLSGNTRVINPGALYGADVFTVAILDPETGKVERILIDAE
ncbi:MAG TPA: YfcE family phosphodiesterase [Spirochaetota bacterium]|nr:YfcE family phosphodiesterase [Spirochaetota bacterium]HOD15152.1 YfcE family phosphodiesterase [Spirochaetota bacterium]HPG51672.1 YfcE family phosphodiesterase [Spirochaetota bacterium]HQL84012.1 YfcE family phosphodiesterase [Spirochaetota bacterium]